MNAQYPLNSLLHSFLLAFVRTMESHCLMIWGTSILQQTGSIWSGAHLLQVRSTSSLEPTCRRRRVTPQRLLDHVLSLIKLTFTDSLREAGACRLSVHQPSHDAQEDRAS
jgi:hypothetical protein